MPDKATDEILYEGGYISEKQLKDIKEYRALNIFSLNLELRFLLYAGVLAVTTGLGILVYENIDTIGHTIIIICLGLACAGCFFWCSQNAKGFSRDKIVYSNPFFDYVLLVACLLAGIFIAYIQYQYNLFGTHYGIATLLPTILYFFSAYYFDHRGVLSLAITGVGAWLGITVSPTTLFSGAFRYSAAFDYTGLLLGIALVLWVWYSIKENLKLHFNFTYLNFALHLLFLSSLSGLFNQQYWFLFVIPISATAYYFIRMGLQMPSFNFLLFSTLYSYIAFTYLIFKIFERILFDGAFTLIPLYFIFTLIFIISRLIAFKKKISV